MDSENTGIPATMLVGPTGIGSGNVAYPYPVFGGGMGGGSGMGFGNDGGWIVLLLIIILVAAGGWGNNGSGGGAFGGQPIIVNDGGSSVQRGFDQAAVMTGIGSVQSGIQNLATQLCNCCGDMQMSLCNGFANTTAAITGAQNALSQQLYSNEIASLNRSFAEQTANTAGFNGVQSALCDIRYGSATNTRDIIDSQTRGTQAILDKLCSLELDNYRRENDNLRTQLNMSALRESQTAQTAQILAGQTAEVDALYNRLSQCPVPTEPVYGRQPIFTCPQNNNNCGCGCGGTGGFNGNF